MYVEDVEEIMKAQNGTLSNSHTQTLSLSLAYTREHRKLLRREEEALTVRKARKNVENIK
jgi:hypothetical protein